MRGGRQDRANDLTPLPTARRTFDVIWCIECGAHVHDKQQLVEQLVAPLRPGGRVALCAWCEADALRMLATGKPQAALAGSRGCRRPRPR